MQKKIAVSLPRAIYAHLVRRKQAILMNMLVIAGASVLLLVDIALFPNKLWFFNKFLLRFGLEPFLSALHLLPDTQTAPIPPRGVLIFHLISAPKEIGLFIGAFFLLFLLYFLALHYLPCSLTYRFIWRSTLLLGLLYIFIPIVTSQDIFSYIAYAHIGMLYHLNPLTTAPKIIAGDPVYHYIYWVNQPSIYGPTWVFITYTLQWLALTLGFKSILSMELLFRAFGLLVHLASVRLVWLLSGRLHLSRTSPSSNPSQEHIQRLRATLAFAWNPFLLFETCTNAHNDSSMLFLVLLALWFFFPQKQEKRYYYLFTVLLLALATCLKITAVILLPGFLLFLWAHDAQQGWLWRKLLAPVLMAGLYTGFVLLLYLPFWQHGALLHTIQSNPGTSRDINSLYEILVVFYVHLKSTHLAYTMDHGSHTEIITHMISMGLFVILYSAICLRSLFMPQARKTLSALASWIALVWLLYCLIGSPWFWPWYTILFFGPAALVEAGNSEEKQPQPFWNATYCTLFVRVLTISMLSFYSFGNLKPDAPPFAMLPHLRWMYLRGIWLWLPPLIALCAIPLLAYLQKYRKQKET